MSLISRLIRVESKLPKPVPPMEIVYYREGEDIAEILKQKEFRGKHCIPIKIISDKRKTKEGII